MNIAQVEAILETYLQYAEIKREKQPLGSMDYAYYDGFGTAIAQVMDEIKKADTNPFKDIPNPLENEYQWP